jgi:hypothetical protein
VKLSKSLFLVRLVHTAIFVFMSACIGAVVVSAATGSIGAVTWVAFGLVVVEAVVFVGNGWRCPLTDYAERLGAASGSVADIFLPPWFARRLPFIASAVFGLASLGLALRLLR